MRKKLSDLKLMIGQTPLIEIFFRYQKKEYSFYAKVEYYNFTGSIKDRVVYEILKHGIRSGQIKENTPLIEVTSGNTGISLAAMGAYLDLPVTIFLPEWMSDERKLLLKQYGANLVLVSRQERGFIGGLELAKKMKGFHVGQFENKYNVLAHERATAPEIYNALSAHNKIISGVVSGVGTGGTLMGLGRFLKKRYPHFKTFALEPSTSRILKGEKGEGHLIEGISDQFVPTIYSANEVNDIVDITNEQALGFAQKMCQKLGIGVGISSGAAAAAAIKLTLRGEKMVTIFADDNKKYLSTALAKQTAEDAFLFEIEFVRFKPL